MLHVRAVCRPCRLGLRCWPCANVRTFKSGCTTATSPFSRPRLSFPLLHAAKRSVTTDGRPSDAPADDAGIDAAAPPPDEAEDLTLSEDQRLEIARARIGPEAIARHARLRFGDRLPQNALNEQEYKIYERLFGEPLPWSPAHEQDFEGEGEGEGDALLKESEDGSLEEIDYETADPEALEGVDPELRKDIEAALSEAADEDDVPEDRAELTFASDADIAADSDSRGLGTHPFTLAARSGTDPSTLTLPAAELTRPVTEMLSGMANRHLRDVGTRLLGGPGLPYSTGTPKSSRTMAQKPIPLDAYQTKMTPIEADIFMAAIMPGMYASLTSALVETRRVLGSNWLEQLLLKEGGPSILDAGAGGAGVLAWHGILRAEWDALREARGAELDIGPDSPTPLGKATVLTSSDALRYRASALLDNTTFLPRLPDYVHIEPRKPGEPGTPHGRKQFDVILAPHSLWSLPDERHRRQHVQNLWAMLNENGGILVLLEKGVPRGFEVLAGARQYLLDNLFLNDEEPRLPEQPNSHHRHATPGAIVAPCTTHAKCPMYRVPGVSRQRKDYCRFSQRYHRPSYHQNILGARSRNHEDVEFSYVSVVRGKRPDELGVVQSPDNPQLRRARLQGKLASDRAFAGYELGDADLIMSEGQRVEASVVASTKLEANDDSDEPADAEADKASVVTTPLPDTPAPHPLTLPRMILPALKKPRHIFMDVCTPAGTLERWSVTRSYGRQAYRDARKSAWGDLWALGAKSREGRRLRVGKGILIDGGKPDDDDAGAWAKRDAGAPADDDEQQPRKLRGREKARTRKREERRAMNGDRKGDRKRRKRPADAEEEEEEEED